jgi:hypothetical protein
MCCLINSQRVEKSASAGGKRQMQCKWSGITTMANVSNGRSVRTRRMTSPKVLTMSGSASQGQRWCVTTVKK